ncbi:hypothetical protein MAR_031917 [Mya arenaria]|uniref:Uncharacterized protein n=2 Tax=Mya arenaria TaxID=6604 RepID=A0ABY7F566_MYAAR|nr:hypothetical protein MAR_031917 [Mya arenaria]
MVTMYILKRRRRVTELKAEVHERQTSFGTGPANTDGNNQYEELDKRERVTPHNEAYEMLQTSTNPVDNKQEEDKEKDYEFDGGNVYYNER